MWCSVFMNIEVAFDITHTCSNAKCPNRYGSQEHPSFLMGKMLENMQAEVPIRLS